MSRDRGAAIPLPIGLLVALLAAASGIVDAFAFLQWQVFVANQTGNLVVVAISLIGSEFPDAVMRSIVALLGFLAGVVAGWALRNRSRRDPTPKGLLLWLQAAVLVFCLAAGAASGRPRLRADEGGGCSGTGVGDRGPG